ncbi:BTAD domain-containing putative transcriptional regulator [Nocardia sp. NPDC058058]|uniref:BTAD domain-containing putative transcriptional regulator n=1 Tax=Nocardia sp. NPDC058058 TaxID=3346317 RepID=UPI0036D8C818
MGDIDADPLALRFALLNGVEARSNGQPLDLGPPQRRAVLCALAIRRRQWVPVSSLVAALYESDRPVRGVSVVQTHISALRRVLEPHRSPRAPAKVLLSGHGGYQLLIADEQLDLGVFEQRLAEAESARDRAEWDAAQQRYENALRVFSGDALPGIPGPFAAAQRAVLVERRLSALEDHLDAMIRAQRSDQAIDRLRGLISEQPLRERPPVLLMRALHDQGRRSEALDVYTATRRLLIDRLGVEPGPELRAVHSGILSGRALPAPVVPPPTPLDVPPASAGDGDCGSIIGRDAELARFTVPAERAAAGHGGLAAVVGYRGFGTSAIVRALGVRIPAARTVWVDAGKSGEPGELALYESLAGALDPAAPKSSADRGDADVRRELLRGLTGAAADGLLLVLIDDISRADDRSIGMLAALAPQLRDLRVLVIVAVEDQQWDPVLGARQAALERSAQLVVRVGPLGDAAVAELARRRLGAAATAELIDDIARATAGIPDLLVGVIDDIGSLPEVRRLPRRLPEGAYTMAMRHQLGSATVALLDTYRVMNALPEGQAELAVIAAVVGEPVSETRYRCELLSTANVLSSIDPPVFRHPLIGNTVRQLRPAGDDSVIHLAAARHARAVGRPVREIAGYLHELHGDRYSEWTPLLVEAAQECVLARATDEAMRHLESALRIAGPDARADVLVRLGALEQFTNPVAARHYLEQALAAQRAARASPTALVPLLWTLATQRQSAAAAALLEEVLAETRERDPVAARAIHATRWVIAGMRPESWAAYLAELRCGADDPISRAVLVFDDAFGVGCSGRVALDRFSAALRGSGGPAPREMYGMLGQLALWADDLTLAWQLTDQRDDRFFGAIDIYRAAMRAEIHCRRAEFALALEECALPARAVDGRVVRYPPVLAIWRAYALLGLGRLEEAAEWAEIAAAGVNPELLEWLLVNTARGVIASVRGRAREAAGCFLETGRRAVDWGLVNPGFLPWRSLAARELARFGETDRAAELAAAELELARRWGVDRGIGLALRGIACTAPDSRRIAVLEEAVRHLRRGEAVTELLSTLMDLARAHAAAGEQGQVRTVLIEAYAIAQPRGALLCLDRVDTLWREYVSTAGPPWSSGPHSVQRRLNDD